MTEQAYKPTVLVVDDEPQILESIHDLLEDDFEVLASTDTAQAVEFLKNAQIAVILADQRMPKLTGGEFLAKAREISDATRILITGYVDIDALIRAVNDGQIHSYVPKPWDPADLKITVLRAATYAKEIRQRKRAAEIVGEQQKALARSEAAYRQQTKILRSVLDSMGDGVLVADDSGKMVLLNPAAENMVGPDATETPRSEWSQHFGIYRPGTDTLYTADELPLARAMRGETADGIELYVRNQAKPEGMFVSVSVRPIKDDSGNIKGGVAVVRDITLAKSTEAMLRQAKEEAERANRAKSEFLSRMSHELRTPLNSILGFAQLLALADLGVQHQNSVQLILKGGYHLLELINEVLDLARIEAGRLSLSPEPVRIEDAVKEALDLVRPIASLQNITLSADFSAYRDRSVQADRQRLKQVLLNLLSNAIKFNRNNGLVVLRCEEAPNHRLRVEVADTGPGIDEEGLRKIFTPFERLGADRNAVGGTGLGLALSKRMIEAMGGTLGVQSTVGVGSRFHFELSLIDHTGEQKEHRDLSAALRTEGQGGSSYQGTILYIEDNLSNLRLIEEILTRYPGVHLLEAMQGKLGLELANTHTPDWILLDLHLPDMPGEEVLHTLRQNQLTQRIPVTILSADATPGQIDRLQAAGAREYLTKPLDVRQLIALLEDTLRREHPEKQADESVRISLPPPQEQSGTTLRWVPETITLTGLPTELLQQLLSAVQDGEKDRLDALIAAVINQGDSRSALALKDLADKYEYDTLTHLLTEASK
ncbi:MAG TPA: response regulator [Bryobacteraceae bacterium]|nr:response regulator [Bryobacteraceae bacterium]HUO29610.1 response regulator [Bryobacteraceae bacterium]